MSFEIGPAGSASVETRDLGGVLELERDGVEVIEEYLPPATCDEVLAVVRSYAAAHALPLIVRKDGDRALRYRVIDGNAIHASLPVLTKLYDDVRRLVQQRDPCLEPVANRMARMNVNLTPFGGEYRWHYDRNAVTAILFLNAVDGGETEMYPNFRIRLARLTRRVAGLRPELPRMNVTIDCHPRAPSLAASPSSAAADALPALSDEALLEASLGAPGRAHAAATGTGGACSWRLVQPRTQARKGPPQRCIGAIDIVTLRIAWEQRPAKGNASRIYRDPPRLASDVLAVPHTWPPRG